ncbi:hypothetical protein Tco_1541537 [Tanacetum coccineum]
MSRKMESLLTTFTVFKKESKEKENKYIDKESDLENKIKELDNIVYKVGQSAQTVHMLMKPQVFYDDTHKQALGYQNLFYLKKAQRIKPTLYDGIVISKKHEVIFVDDSEETLILEEESRSKMLAKQNDPISKEKKIHISPINYSELNKLSEDFGKNFVPQKQLYTEQAFWLPLSNPNSEQFVFSHTSVKIEVPKELPKVVKDRITPTTITEDGWGFEHTKKVFLEEVIPFINSLRSSFKDFDNGLYSELNEVKMVFNQMEACVEQYLEHTAVNSLEVIDECKSMKKAGELLAYVSETCPGSEVETKKLVVVTPMNKTRKVRSQEPKVLQIVLWYLDSGCSKHMTGQRSQLIKFVEKILSTVRFGNDQIAKIMGYGDYQMGNVMISRVYYVEGLGHNLFFVGKSSCHILLHLEPFPDTSSSREDLGKLKPKADIGIFIGYAPAKKAYWIYNRLIFMDTAYGRRWIRRIGNCEYAFSCEDLALIRRISFPGYGVLVRNE